MTSCSPGVTGKLAYLLGSAVHAATADLTLVHQVTCAEAVVKWP
ncbi:MAG TPA: hypothetical protein VN428_08930 [Bryobacteraceae bacterium]|nr:hypothetical protein [Bryobacteraceae bacterium]